MRCGTAMLSLRFNRKLSLMSIKGGHSVLNNARG